MTRRLFTFLIATSLPFAAIASEDQEAHAFAIGDLAIEHAWAPATTADDAFVYMDLHNLGDTPVLISGARTEIAEKVALVGFALKDGVSTPTELVGLPLPAGRELELAPNQLAFQLSGLTAPLVEGEHLEMTLTTELGELPFTAEIGAPNATQHSHAGHSHMGEIGHE